ncbi:MAG: PEP-CTERM sorting domain-containing protein [Pirellulaceae bacterium]|nr:PEP-CTERM sorting domain-containing protein [Pirellulaceae bacterium]
MRVLLNRNSHILSAYFVVVAAIALAGTANAEIIFSENFNAVDTSDGSVAVNTSPANTAFTVNRNNYTSPNNISIRRDTSERFGGEADDNYLRLLDGSTTNAPRLVGSVPIAAGGVFQLSFDVIDPFDPEAPQQDVRIRLMGNYSTSATITVGMQFKSGRLMFRYLEDLEEEFVNDIPYESNTLYHFDLVGNYGDESVEYGVRTLASKTFDVYVDGVLARSGFAFANDVNYNTHLALVGGSNVSTGELLLDNIVFRDDITLSPIPEPSTGILLTVLLAGFAAVRRRQA